MASDLLTREPIAEFGEFRAYLRAERHELVFEAFRESDGRAWLLRVPLAARAAMTGLLRDCGPPGRRALGQSRPGILRQVTLGPKDALAAVLLEEGLRPRLRPVATRAASVGMGVDHRRGRGPARTRRRVCGLMRQVIERTGTTPPRCLTWYQILRHGERGRHGGSARIAGWLPDCSRHRRLQPAHGAG